MENINIKNLNLSQRFTLKKLLDSKENIFLTGLAGTGKSQVIKLYRQIEALHQIQRPIVASTGAAALLVNGVTFTSFFGLGMMVGSKDNIINKAMSRRQVCERIIYTDTIIVDEISMISGLMMEVANELCQKVRQNNKFFGGMRIICVGDFAQLGPYSETNIIDWCFKNPVWKKAKFKIIQLKQVMRTNDKEFLEILSNAREAKIDQKMKKFLDSKIYKGSYFDFEGARIFSRNKEVDDYNNKKLENIKSPLIKAPTKYVGEKRYIDIMKRNLIIGDSVEFKQGALVMTRVNNPSEGYINGTIGKILQIHPDRILIRTLNGHKIYIRKHIFEFHNGAGELVAAAKNFPITLAWAITIHKSQGATLDKALISLKRLWLPGQAYTALSRLKTGDGLYLTDWNPESFIADPDVLKLYRQGLVKQKKEETMFLKEEVKEERQITKNINAKKVFKKKAKKKKVVKKRITKKKTTKKKASKKKTKKKVSNKTNARKKTSSKRKIKKIIRKKK